mmetsp:Transcript_109275/g.315821  ORF Transcript_109275/g.315821 Transcript_109275/m.315821 type:complete len:208 (+) Transcript_109275:441-1064(+)
MCLPLESSDLRAQFLHLRLRRAIALGHLPELRCEDGTVRDVRIAAPPGADDGDAQGLELRVRDVALPADAAHLLQQGAVALLRGLELGVQLAPLVGAPSAPLRRPVQRLPEVAALLLQLRQARLRYVDLRGAGRGGRIELGSLRKHLGPNLRQRLAHDGGLLLNFLAALPQCRQRLGPLPHDLRLRLLRHRGLGGPLLRGQILPKRG